MSSQNKKKTEYIHIRLDSESKQEIVNNAEERKKTITDYILDSVITPKEAVMTNRIDTKILKKLLKPFKKHAIKVNLSKEEISRIKELWSEVQNA